MKVQLRQHGQPDEKHELFAFDFVETIIRDDAGDELTRIVMHVLPGGELDIYVSAPAPISDDQV